MVGFTYIVVVNVCLSIEVTGIVNASMMDCIVNIRLMEEILHQLRLVVYPIIYRNLYIPGGAGFLPSTVLLVDEM